MNELARQVARRLQAVRIVCDIRGNRALGEMCGASPSAVNNWLSAYNLPRVPEMMRLCTETGITLDWLYRGYGAGMDAELGIKLANTIANEPLKD